MPLSFLTADPAPTESAGAAVHEDRERWRRPYRPGPWRVAGAALLLLLASYLLLSALIIAVAGATTSAAVCAGLALATIAGALRLLRVGIWVGAHGLRQVAPLYTTTLPWSRVASVRTAQQPVKWLGLPRTVQGQALVVTPRGGERGEQDEPLRPLLTDHNADFLGRSDAFERATDILEAWASEHRGGGSRAGR